MPYFINTILPLPLPKAFTYLVSEKEYKFLSVGSRVVVPFGKSKIYTAIVVKKHNTPPQKYEAKEIHAFLEETPIVTESQLKLWEWVAEYYKCTVGEVLKTALPAAFLLESETTILKKEIPNESLEEMTDDEYLIYEALSQGELSIKNIVQIINKQKVLPILYKMLAKDWIELKQKIVDKYIPKKVRYITLAQHYQHKDALAPLLTSLEKKPKQKEVLLKYFSEASPDKKHPLVEAPKFLKKNNYSHAILKTMVDAKIFTEEILQKDRIIYEETSAKSNYALTPVQTKMVKDIQQKFTKKNTVLLHGITASGKTEIYITLIKEILSQQKQVLFLVPEIALSFQILKRLQKVFGKDVCLYHSNFSLQERTEIWKNMLHKTDSPKVIIGTRLALFLPFQALGLVIVDEEHETAYKQMRKPFYNGRDTATMLAGIHNTNILLGSATPSIETAYNCDTQKYEKVLLTERFQNTPPPKISCIDLKTSYKKKQMKGFFSLELINAIKEVLAEGKQVILFQNRRGYSSTVLCNTCGYIPKCANCDVSLTYHSVQSQLKCHYCNYTVSKPHQCSACGSMELDFKGIGTQQIQEQAQHLFPDNIIERMDTDNMKRKGAFDKLFEAFNTNEIQILVGTQMITKGLDFQNVSLVGVINADYLLNYPTFRAHEQGFQTLLQVAGRAGRSITQGKVLLQTFQPKHTILQQVIGADYEGMFNIQLKERKQFFFPPFCRLIKITLKHQNYSDLDTAAKWFHNALSTNTQNQVLGPIDPLVARIKNKYHKQILIKIEKTGQLKITKAMLNKVVISFHSFAPFRKIQVEIDVDPL